VKYLLDVNTLVALGHTTHVHHARAQAWLQASRSTVESMGTCAITELGFVRVSVQAGLQRDIASARAAFSLIKKSSPIKFEFFSDAVGVDKLPAYVKGPGDLTDGHLLELARAHGIQLATLDAGIPGSFYLPDKPGDWVVEEMAAAYGRKAVVKRTKSRRLSTGQVA